MPFSEIPGQEKAKAMIGRALRTGRVAHAYLFAGERGLGKEALARGFAQSLSCNSEPDVCWVEPSPSTIGIEQIRRLIGETSLRPFSGRRKVAVLKDAHKLTEQAANALLKTLEDPPSYQVIILITDTPGSLPLTVVSRCQGVPFHAVNEETLASYLSGRLALPPGAAAALAILSGGNPGLAETLAASGTADAARRLSARVVSILSESGCSPLDLADLADELDAWKGDANQGRAAALEVLDYLALAFRDLSVLALDPAARAFLWDGSANNPLSGKAGARRYLAAFRSVSVARSAISANANRRLTFHVLAGQLHAVLTDPIMK